jgi:Domain of unknown function (DUF5673)
MSDPENHVETMPRDATEVRFGMRAMLIVMSVVAVATGGLGAFIRHFPPNARPQLAAYWGILGVAVIGLIAYHARRRYVVERQAGHVLFLLEQHSYFLPHAPGLATIIGASLLLAFAPLMWVVGSFAIAEGDWWLWSNPSGIWSTSYCLIAAGTGITLLWWRRVRIAEHGLVVRSKFVPWENCRRWYWDACNKDVVVLESPQFKRVAVKVPAEVRAAIESLLKEKSPKMVAGWFLKAVPRLSWWKRN